MLLLPEGNTGHRRLEKKQLKNYSEIWGSFFEKVEFFWISTHFSDFVLIFIDIAEAHARGFAPL